MKIALLFLFFVTSLWAKPIVLLSYFDPFLGGKTNNSEKVALLVKENLKDTEEFEIHLCQLPTIFDKSFAVWEECLRKLPAEPTFSLSLGEGICDFALETMGRNLDSGGPDNEGTTRSKLPIDPKGPEAIGLYLPLQQMYCSLPKLDRTKVMVSNSAGSFICNELTYNVATHYEHLNFGFIHVPNHNCPNVNGIDFAVKNIMKMIPVAVSLSRFERLPTTKSELEHLRKTTTFCEREFYKKAKGIDEKSFLKLSVRE